MKSWLSLIAVPIALAGCQEVPTEDVNPNEIVTFEFLDLENDQRFRARTNNQEVIDLARAQLALPFEERHPFPNGALVRGDGGVNQPWSWSLDEINWKLSELAPEVCDGKPSDVESDLDYWVDSVGSFCPWSSKVDREINEPRS